MCDYKMCNIIAIATHCVGLSFKYYTSDTQWSRKCVEMLNSNHGIIVQSLDSLTMDAVVMISLRKFPI